MPGLIVHIKPPHIRPPRALWEIVAPVVAIVGLILLVRGCVVLTTQSEDWSPVRVLPLSVSPDPVVLGQPATLLNGVCLDQDAPLAVGVYLGMQDASGNPLLGSQTIDLIGMNTPEGRRRVTLNKGCQSERIYTIASAAQLRPGRWRLVVVIVATGPQGQQQVITEQSDPFDIVTGT